MVTAAGGGHVDRGAVIGVSGSLPVAGGRADGDHSVAVPRGVRASISAGVSRRGHQHHSARARPIDGFLQGQRAGGFRGERHVDHRRGVRVDPDSVHVPAGRPRDRSRNIGQQSTAPRQCTNWLDAHTGSNIGDHSRGRGAVPGCVPHRRHRPPIPRVSRVRIPAHPTKRARVEVVTIEGDRVRARLTRRRQLVWARDEVIPGHNASIQARMRGDTGIDHRHHRPRTPPTRTRRTGHRTSVHPELTGQMPRIAPA